MTIELFTDRIQTLELRAEIFFERKLLSWPKKQQLQEGERKLAPDGHIEIACPTFSA